MSQNRSISWPVTITIVALLLGLIALPQEYKRWAPGFIRNQTMHFGLDLAGGTQLDFRISERELDEQIASLAREIDQLSKQNADPLKIDIVQQQLSAARAQKRTLVEAIRTVLERRINALGVSEATITPSYIGNEKHLLVECPGVVDVQECIKTVGKTIKLEFKEEFLEPTAEFEESVRRRADTAMKRITQSGETLDIVGQDLSDEIGIVFQQRAGYYEDQLPEGLESLWNRSPDRGPVLLESTIQTSGQLEDGTVQTRDVPGIFLAEVIEPPTATGRVINEAPKAFGLLEEEEENTTYKTHSDQPVDESIETRIISTLRTMQQGDLQVADMDDGSARLIFLRRFVEGEETMEASHILVAYKDAVRAAASVSRSKEEALEKANDLWRQLQDGADFAALAREESDGPSGGKGGSLGEFGRGVMAAPFERTAFALEQGKISSPVETEFGYHIIKSDLAPVGGADIASYDELIITGEGASERAQALLAKLQNGQVQTTEERLVVQALFFSLQPTGWKDTALDGKHFRSATVTVDQVSGLPVVQISFNEEGGKMFQELTAANVGRRIAIFVGGQLVSAPVVQAEIAGGTAIITGSSNIQEARLLAQDLNTGAIPAPIYLAGQRTVEATLGAEALKTSMQAALLGALILMAFMIFMYRVLGVLADIALTIYAFIFFALLKLPLFLVTSQHIVLTLAGMAGIILSIGMAVDANVLIFERMKEELKKGKMLKTAARTGFERAWPSIRDGNVSTFITCSILFLIGTSIIRGFAITLGMGVLLSMFSAIVVTRWLIAFVADTPLGERVELFGGPKPENTSANNSEMIDETGGEA